MSERWFSEEELREMSRPTMDCAIEAIDRGDLEEAKGLCEARSTSPSSCTTCWWTAWPG